MKILERCYCRVFQFCFRAALPLLPYREPAILHSMEQAAETLVEKNKKSVLIVTDKGILGAGLVAPLLTALSNKQIEYTIYADTVPNPTITNVEDAKALYLERKCQAIIGFGGGSSMDCAKICAARIAKPHQPIRKMRGILKIHKKLPLLIAVPTTAGTGSETTVTAVITDADTHYKYPINDFCLIPDYTVLDAQVTLGLPAHLTATTGMDALTHAVEAYIGDTTTRYTRKMAEEAVSLVAAYLKRAYDNGSDKEAREKMLRASFCAGVAFTRSYVGYVHGIAHSLGGQYGTPHGLANAVVLPHMLAHYGQCCNKRLGQLAIRTGIADTQDSDTIAALKFISWIKEMNRSMNIPRFIEGIRDEDIATMAKHAAVESNPLYPVPKLMNAKELENMYYIVGGKHLKLMDSHLQREVSENGNRKIS
ncbi:MAG: iron-containing alcohol dehydrogenase [Lachnospiraceae bacterium]|nr:iron-containing alcohol dehydrogenase [Lachnospiraceae bacterium]